MTFKKVSCIFALMILCVYCFLNQYKVSTNKTMARIVKIEKNFLQQWEITVYTDEKLLVLGLKEEDVLPLKDYNEKFIKVNYEQYYLGNILYPSLRLSSWQKVFNREKHDSLSGLKAFNDKQLICIFWGQLLQDKTIKTKVEEFLKNSRKAEIRKVIKSCNI